VVLTPARLIDWMKSKRSSSVIAALLLKRFAEVSSSFPMRMPRIQSHQARMASMTPVPSDAPPVVLSSFIPDGAMICNEGSTLVSQQDQKARNTA
jgi:hypothetical protein